MFSNLTPDYKTDHEMLRKSVRFLLENYKHYLAWP
jgi:hypothetical protein